MKPPEFRDDFEELESRLRDEIRHLEKFEDEINSMLIKDGYFNEGVEI